MSHSAFWLRDPPESWGCTTIFYRFVLADGSEVLAARQSFVLLLA
ncbi:hypothetical protein [Erwinia tasmaniensis]|nr:hypothetical protein [Erwinia tasmaniensis]